MSGVSDPEKLVSLASDYIRIIEEDVYSVDLLIGRVQHSLVRSGACSKAASQGLAEPLKEALGESGLIEDGTVTDSDEAFRECARVLSSAGYRGYELSDNWMDYDRDRDEVCLVVDRDSGPGGRSASKYRSFLSACESHGYRPYVSNPRFELWILMHFDITGMDDDLADPGRRSGRIDEEMRARRIGKKSRFDGLVGSLDAAMLNSARFCKDLDGLESDTGTNLSDLIRLIGYRGRCLHRRS